MPTVLYLIAVVLLTLAALGINPPRVHLGWLGLALALALATYTLLPHLG